MDKDKQYVTRRRIVGSLSVGAFLTILLLLTLLFQRVFSPYMHSVDNFLAFLHSFGWKGRLILFALQCLQIIVALIPGEIIELGAGYAYGAIEGTLICLAGVALSSAAVFLLVKKWGIPMVESFISRERIQELRFINSEKKLNRLVFILFFLPGTPKDMLTYLIGLTDMRTPHFLAISLLARIPSIVSSTVCGQYLGKQDNFSAGIIIGITAIISLSGYLLYLYIVKKRRNEDAQG